MDVIQTIQKYSEDFVQSAYTGLENVANSVNKVFEQSPSTCHILNQSEEKIYVITFYSLSKAEYSAPYEQFYIIAPSERTEVFASSSPLGLQVGVISDVTWHHDHCYYAFTRWWLNNGSTLTITKVTRGNNLVEGEVDNGSSKSNEPIVAYIYEKPRNWSNFQTIMTDYYESDPPVKKVNVINDSSWSCQISCRGEMLLNIPSKSAARFWPFALYRSEHDQVLISQKGSHFVSPHLIPYPNTEYIVQDVVEKKSSVDKPSESTVPSIREKVDDHPLSFRKKKLPESAQTISISPSTEAPFYPFQKLVSSLRPVGTIAVMNILLTLQQHQQPLTTRSIQSSKVTPNEKLTNTIIMQCVEASKLIYEGIRVTNPNASHWWRHIASFDPSDGDETEAKSSIRWALWSHKQGSSDNYYLVFRGQNKSPNGDEVFEEIISSLDKPACRISPNSDWLVHPEYYDVVESVYSDVMESLQALHKTQPLTPIELYVTGHAVGGTLSQIFAMRYLNDKTNQLQKIVNLNQVVTFGSPMFLVRPSYPSDFPPLLLQLESISRNYIFRFDPIPYLPRSLSCRYCWNSYSDRVIKPAPESSPSMITSIEGLSSAAINLDLKLNASTAAAVIGETVLKMGERITITGKEAGANATTAMNRMVKGINVNAMQLGEVVTSTIASTMSVLKSKVGGEDDVLTDDEGDEDHAEHSIGQEDNTESYKESGTQNQKEMVKVVDPSPQKSDEVQMKATHNTKHEEKVTANDENDLKVLMNNVSKRSFERIPITEDGGEYFNKISKMAKDFIPIGEMVLLLNVPFVIHNTIAKVTPQTSLDLLLTSRKASLSAIRNYADQVDDLREELEECYTMSSIHMQILSTSMDTFLTCEDELEGNHIVHYHHALLLQEYKQM